MAIKAKVGKLEEIEKSLQSLYRQVGQEYVLDVEPVGGLSLEDVETLRKSLQSERGEHTRSRQELGQMRALLGDRDLQKVLEAAGAYEKVNGDLTKDEKFQQALERAAAAVKRDLEDKLSKSEARRAKFEQMLRDQALRAALAPAIAAAKGDADLLMHRAAEFVRVDMSDDGPQLVVLDDERRNPRMTLESGKSGNMPLQEFVEKVLKPRHPRAFDGYATPGAGTTGGTSGSTAATPWQLSREDARDHLKYSAAKEAATKAGKSVEILS